MKLPCSFYVPGLVTITLTWSGVLHRVELDTSTFKWSVVVSNVRNEPADREPDLDSNCDTDSSCDSTSREGWEPKRETGATFTSTSRALPGRSTRRSDLLFLFSVQKTVEFSQAKAVVDELMKLDSFQAPGKPFQEQGAAKQERVFAAHGEFPSFFSDSLPGFDLRLEKRTCPPTCKPQPPVVGTDLFSQQVLPV
jgi:hypothetical protein